MKVLHIYFNYLDGGGVANSLTNLANLQKENGLDVKILTFSSTKKLYEVHSQYNECIIIKRSNLIIINLLKIFYYFIKSKKKLKNYVIHIHGEFNLYNLLIYFFSQSKNIILSSHGAFHPLLVTGFSKKIYLSIAKKLLYDKVKFFHALTEREKYFINNLLGYKNIYVCPNVVRFSSSQNILIKNQSYSDEKKLNLLFVGRLDVFTKGLDILIRVFSKLLNINKNIFLNLIGPKWGNINLEKYININILNNIYILGPKSHSELIYYYKNSDIYCQFSRYESFGLSIFEAFLSGLPVIISRGCNISFQPEITSLSSCFIGYDEDDLFFKLSHIINHIEEIKYEAINNIKKIKKYLDEKTILETHKKFYLN